MARPFIHDDFMLETKTARELFHTYAEPMPILDYHCHLPPDQIARDHRFRNLTEVWLAGDHYKWRLMRAAGVPERFVTGRASDWEKFLKWAETVPRIIRNPLYHWTHLELRKPFGITDRLLNPQTAKGIWEECNARLAEPEFSCRGIMKQWNVVLVCTTDDPTDTLDAHKRIAEDSDFHIRVLPAWRPDKAMAVEDPAAFRAWVERLEAAADVDIRTYDDFLAALRRRHDFFHQMGCRISDHGLDTFHCAPYTERRLRAIFQKVRGGSPPSDHEALEFKSALLYEFAVMDHEKGWVQQFHLCALRNNNRRLHRTIGPDVGGDSILDRHIARDASCFLGRLDAEGRLAKTIVYSLNPCHLEVLATMIGNFQDGSCPGKLQLGSAWWFNDTREGMLRQLDVLSTTGVLATFVGMLTDSRSFLSYARHDYFRRLLCNLLGGEMERGLIPNDLELIGEIVRDISYRNAVRYFGFQDLVPPAP